MTLPETLKNHKKKLGLAGLTLAAAITYAEIKEYTNTLDMNEAGIALVDTACLQNIFQTASGAENDESQPHNIIVIPGWLMGDGWMQPLRANLEEYGHSVHGWSAGTNWGLLNEQRAHDQIALLENFILDLSRESEQPITLVGYSHGGLYAHALAIKYPDIIDHVVTLSSPLNLRTRAGDMDPSIERIYSAVSGNQTPYTDWPDSVDLTAIISPSDLVVNWRSAIPQSGSQNIAINYGHMRLPFANDTALVIANSISNYGAHDQCMYLD